MASRLQTHVGPASAKHAPAAAECSCKTNVTTPAANAEYGTRQSNRAAPIRPRFRDCRQFHRTLFELCPQRRVGGFVLPPRWSIDISSFVRTPTVGVRRNVTNGISMRWQVSREAVLHRFGTRVAYLVINLEAFLDLPEAAPRI